MAAICRTAEVALTDPAGLLALPSESAPT